MPRHRAAALLAFVMAKKIPHPTDEHVGSRVRMRRKMVGLTLEQLGAALGLSYQQVQRYENGRNRIGASRLKEIGHILGASASFFFEGGPNAAGPNKRQNKASRSYVFAFLATADGLALVKAFLAIEDTKLRRSIVALLRELAAN
jgi:transcriptional regulator with XRE-family HTH domain